MLRSRVRACSRAPEGSRMRAPDWLTARPIAHRGLHDAARGVIENTASGFQAAIARNYAIERYIHIGPRGEARGNPDGPLAGLPAAAARLAALSAGEIKAARFKATTDRIL